MPHIFASFFQRRARKSNAHNWAYNSILIKRKVHLTYYIPTYNPVKGRFHFGNKFLSEITAEIRYS